MACFAQSFGCPNHLDNLELSLGELCDLIQTDEADVALMAGDATGLPWAVGQTEGCNTQWFSKEASQTMAKLDYSKRHQLGNQSSSSLLSDSEMFMKQERTAANNPCSWPSSHGMPILQTKTSDSPGCDGAGSPTLGSAASMQHLPPRSQSNVALHPVLQHANSFSLDDDEFDAMSRPPVSHSSVEKQRRDRLNTLMEKLSEIVPPSDDRYAAAAPGTRRPKHVVLSDAIRSLRTMQEHMRTCSYAAGVPLPPRPCKSGSPSTGDPTTPPSSATPRISSLSASCSALDMPLLLDISSTSTGVMVEAVAGSAVWKLRVTCRDRPGLLADVAVSLRGLPINITAASVTTTSEGKAQQVFELALLDLTLSPEEVQCAVNAALYSHLLPRGAPTEQPPANPQAPAKRQRLA